MGDVRARLAELSPEEVEHFLKEVPRLLAEGCQFQQLVRCLSDFDFLEAKVNHPGFGVQALIEDYDWVDDSEILTHPGYNPEKVKTLRLIQGALRLSAHILAKDKTQLVEQLWGRMQCFELHLEFVQWRNNCQFHWGKPIILLCCCAGWSDHCSRRTHRTVAFPAPRRNGGITMNTTPRSQIPINIAPQI